MLNPPCSSQAQQGTYRPTEHMVNDASGGPTRAPKSLKLDVPERTARLIFTLQD